MGSVHRVMRSVDAGRDCRSVAVGSSCPTFVIDGGDHAMESDLRTFEDHKNITWPDLLVQKPEANDRRKS